MGFLTLLAELDQVLEQLEAADQLLDLDVVALDYCWGGEESGLPFDQLLDADREFFSEVVVESVVE
jgi:hypothetical protein